jgi:DNA-directed RNA polymerase specialized sigma24 family protein
MHPDEFFATRWPALIPELRRALAKAGAPAAERNDLVQETAVRLLGMWERIAWDRPIGALAHRIALNAWRDQWRHRGAREVVGPVPEQQAAGDTERSALARVEIGEVARALADLPANTANVLRLAAAESEIAPVGAAVGAASPALRMARTRARRALAVTMRIASAVAAVVAFSWRTLGRSARTSTASLGVLATAAFVLAGGAGWPHTRPAPLRADRPIVAIASPMRAVVAHRPAVAQPTRRGFAGAALRGAHRKPAARPTPYYYVGPKAAQVGVFVDVNVQGYGVRVERPGTGTDAPACTSGNTPTVTSVPRCPD